MMWANGGASPALPQLHVGGRYYGDVDALQQLEDEGRFDALLWSARHNLFGAAPAAAATARSATAGPSAADARFGYWAAGGGAGPAAPPIFEE